MQRRRKARKRLPPGSTNRRGYGIGHRNLRTDALAELALNPGMLCPQTWPDGRVCNRPMYPGQDLDLGHANLDRTKYIGLVHAACNRSAGPAWAALLKRVGITRRLPRQRQRGRRQW